MVTEFKFPDVGEGIHEGEIVKWLVKVGDTVKADQNIVQIETDKAVVDIPSPVAGKILKINFQEGQTVKVGEVLVVIGNGGDKVQTQVKATKEKPAKEEKEGTIEKQLHSEHMKSDSSKVLAFPAVRKKASELGIDLSKVTGTGAGGTVTLKDLGDAKEGRQIVEKIPQQTISVKKKYDDYGYLERVPLKGIRKTIAENMIKSQTEAAQVTAMEDIDVTKLWSLREKEKSKLAKDNVKLTFLPFIIKAIISALKENPILNSSIEGDEILIRKYFNIGVAVETEVGLMVPVIKIAESKSIVQIAIEIEQLAEKARKRTIDLMDLQGSTFTITNYGSIGGTYGTPILNKGEAGIIGLGRIFDRVVPDGNRTRNAKILPISLTFDHRILDGAQAARFLESLKSYLEDPDNLLMDLK